MEGIPPVPQSAQPPQPPQPQRPPQQQLMQPKTQQSPPVPPGLDPAWAENRQPAPAGQAADALVFATGQFNKVHHSYVWLNALVGLGAVVAISVVSNISSFASLFSALAQAQVNILLVVALIVVALFLVYAVAVGVLVLAYRNLRFVFDEKEFSLYSGILIKRRMHVPYNKVQSVNHRQSLIQRLAGVCAVEIDTAGGSSNRAIKVPYVLLGTGEAIRHDLFARKAAEAAGVSASDLAAAAARAGAAGGSAAGSILDAASDYVGVSDFRGVFDSQAAGMEPVSFERRLTNGELALCTTSASAIVGAAVVFVLVLFAMAIVVATLGARASLPILMAMPVVVISLLAVLAVNVAAVALSFGNFSVRRRGSRIEVERGILQRDFSGIDVNRIQSLVVRQSFVRRLLGYCEVSLGRINAAGDGNQNTQAKLNSGALVVHPFLKVSQVDALLAGLLPEFADRPVAADFQGLPAVALRRGIVRRCLLRNVFFWLLVALAACCICDARLGLAGPGLDQVMHIARALVPPAAAVCVVGIGMSAWSTVLWKRGSGYAMARRYLALRNDGLSTETAFFPRSKVQDVNVRTNPFQRRAGVATIGVRTAAGTSATRTALWDAPASDAHAWLRWVVPEAAHSGVS